MDGRDEAESALEARLSALPSIAPSLVANTLKGITARHVFKTFPEVKKHVWGGSF